MKASIITASVFSASVLALGSSVAPAAADVVERQVTETETTTVSGTVSEISPSSRIVIQSSSGAPKTYTINKSTTFVDEEGNTVTYDQVQGRPVRIYVHETTREEPVVVERVVVSKPAAPRVLQRSETRVETTEED